MSFNGFRAIVLGIVLWLLIFVEVSVLLFGFRFPMGGDAYYVSHFVLLVFFSLLVSLIYFYKVRMGGGFLHGLCAGILFIVVGVLLDLAITVPFFVKDYGFFLRADVLIGMVVVLVISGLVGMGKR
jgi:hypothetical protein|tara:strand:- start:107 stop:484 length:378 start_codon:yes stop_codon:yes gene_type:complete